MGSTLVMVLLVGSLVTLASCAAAQETSPLLNTTFEWPDDLPLKFNWCEKGACGISRNQCDGSCTVHAWYGTQESQYWISTGQNGTVHSVSAQAYKGCRGNNGTKRNPLSLEKFDKTNGLFFEETWPEAGNCRMCTNEFLPVMQAKLGECYPALKNNFTEDPCLIRDYYFRYKQFPRDIKAGLCKVHRQITPAQQAGWDADNNSTVHSRFGTYADCKKNFDPVKSCTCPQERSPAVQPDVAPGVYNGIYFVPIKGDILKVARLLKTWGPQRTALSGAEAGEPNIDVSNQACAKGTNHEAIVVGWDRTGRVPKWIIRNSELPNNDVYGLGYVDMDCPHCGDGGCALMSTLAGKATVNVFVDPTKVQGDSRGKFADLLAIKGTTYRKAH